MNRLSELSGLADAEIETLKAEGIDLTPADIVEINALAWNVESPESRISLSRGNPVFVGGATLWPLTMQGADWLERVGYKFPTQTLTTFALAYALANGYSDNKPFDCGAVKGTLKVAKFATSLKCNWNALNVAIAEILGQDQSVDMPPPQEDDTGEKISIGELSVYLTSISNESAEFWERRCSVSYACAVLHRITQQNKADDKPSDSDPRIQAEIALGWCIEKIRQRNLNNG